MDLTLYQNLTGKTVPESRKQFMEAQLKRVQSKLETLLGYTLEPQHLYTELGKTVVDCFCSNTPETLLPSDPVKGIYKVFPYNWKDKFLHIDPYIDVYVVKLVKVLENRSFVTVKTFDHVSKQYMRNGIGLYIEKCDTCFCDSDCKSCVQLAVDADWVDFTDENSDLPDDLLYLWADMVDYYADPYRNIKSESVDGHSWSKGDIKAPEEDKDALLVLKRYAGVFGTINRVPTT